MATQQQKEQSPNPRRTGEPVDDELQQPEQVPSFLTARELQSKDPAPEARGEKMAKENPGAKKKGGASPA